MELKRMPKTGMITKQNIVKTALVTLTAGTVALGGITYQNYIDENKKLELSSNYKSYGEQIEELFHVNLSKDNEDSLNKLEGISILIDEWKQEKEQSKKESLMKKLLENKGEIVDLSLYVLKSTVAKENSGKWSDYTISYEPADGSWCAYGKEGYYNLNGDSYKMASAIGKFQDLVNKESMKETEDKKIINGYENLIKSTAKFIKNTSNKTK